MYRVDIMKWLFRTCFLVTLAGFFAGFTANAQPISDLMKTPVGITSQSPALAEVTFLDGTKSREITLAESLHSTFKSPWSYFLRRTLRYKNGDTDEKATNDCLNIDPGFVIMLPDSTIDINMPIFRPDENLDPAMIFNPCK